MLSLPRRRGYNATYVFPLRSPHQHTSLTTPMSTCLVPFSLQLLGQLPPELPKFDPNNLEANELEPNAWDLLPDLGRWQEWGTGTIIAAVALAICALVLVSFVFRYGGLWLRAYMSEADVSFWHLVGMGFRQVDAALIVDTKVMAAQAALDIGEDGITTRRLEAHYLAGGNVARVMRAIIAAQRANIDLDFDRAAAIDLAGRDVEDAVRTSVHPKVIDCPDPARSGKKTLSAVAKDGVELRIRAQVTVRTNLEQLIGGATEDTVIARVGEGIITAIGSADMHEDVLANPERISHAVHERGLDSQTAFSIVSIDVADIDVGERIGARLRLDRADADTRVARAEAEKRRAEAVADEQEMRARVAENRARVVEAEADVPQAMSEAIRAGRIFDHE